MELRRPDENFMSADIKQQTVLKVAQDVQVYPRVPQQYTNACSLQRQQPTVQNGTVGREGLLTKED